METTLKGKSNENGTIAIEPREELNSALEPLEIN